MMDDGNDIVEPAYFWRVWFGALAIGLLVAWHFGMFG